MMTIYFDGNQRGHLMFERTGKTIDLGEALEDLAEDQAEWSQATFGKDVDRGPIGALRHLELEAGEAIAAAINGINLEEELADCFLLILDASRRHGLTPPQLLRVAREKMAVNKSRSWPKPIADQPVEHVSK